MLQRGPRAQLQHMLARLGVFEMAEGSAIHDTPLLPLDIPQENWSLRQSTEEAAPVLTRQESSQSALLYISRARVSPSRSSIWSLEVTDDTEATSMAVAETSPS
jgi:hypothetical protein